MLRPLITLLVSSSLSLAAAQTTVAGFDGVSAPGPFAFIFPGFANGPAVDVSYATFDGGVILLDALFGQSATSGDNIYATCDTCALGDGSGLPGLIDATFGETVDAVALDVINGSSAAGGTFTLTARNVFGDIIASDSVFATSLGTPNFVKSLAVAADGIRSITVEASLPTGSSFAVDTIAFHRTAGWDDLGAALAGVQGAPLLAGAGSPSAGESISVDLVAGPPSGSATLVLGLSTLNARFKGGTLVPSPDTLLFGLPLNTSGEASLATTWPSGVPAGTRILLQAWMPDATALEGFSATNGLRLTAQG